MNDNSREHPDWFLWLWEKGPVLFMVFGLAVLAGFVAFTYRVDSRLDQIEDRLSHSPPRSFQPPNLDDFAAGDVSLDENAASHWVYVPVYSHIFFQGGSPYPLETTLSIRNVDPNEAIFLSSVEYFDTEGESVKEHVNRTIKLKPLQTIEFLVERQDSSGGSGANFLVHWMAESEVDRPMIESVMVGTAGTQGICFKSAGIEISSPREKKPAAD